MNVLISSIAGIVGFMVAYQNISNKNKKTWIGGGKIRFHYEKINSQNDIDFWLQLIENEKNEQYIKYKEQWERRLESPLGSTERDRDLTMGFYSLYNVIKEMKPPELNIVYCSPVLASRKKIEMLMSISMTEGLPIQMHMGIQRTFSYMLNSENEQHKNISIMLHSFGGYLFSDTNHFVISKPVKKMVEILQKELGESVLVDTNMDLAKKEKRDGTDAELQEIADHISKKRFFPIEEIIYPTKKLRVWNRDRKIVFEYDYNSDSGFLNNSFFNDGKTMFNWLVNPKSHLWLKGVGLRFIAIDTTVLAKYYNEKINGI